MSVESTSLVWKHSQATGTTRVVLLAIADHDGEGGAWPSIPTLARMARVKDRAVQRSISELVEMGELVVHRNAGGTHRTPNDRRPNRYEITLPPVDNSPDRAADGVSYMTPRDVDGVSSETERGVIPDANGVSPTTPEPPMNHPDPPARLQPAAETTTAGGRAVDKPSQITDLEQAFAARERLAPLTPFRRLDQATVDQLTALVDEHGVDKLTRYADATALTARSVKAFIGDWLDLPRTTAPRDVGPRCDICNHPAGAHPWAGCSTFTESRTA